MNDGLEGVVAADTVLSHTDGDTGTMASQPAAKGRPDDPAGLGLRRAAAG